MKTRTVMIVIAAGLLANGCKRGLKNDNPDVAADFRDSNKYQDDIVTAKKRRDYDDQGKGIDPKTLQAIEHAIESVYQRDFERCLEEQMSEHDTRFMRSAFTVEFRIDPSGKSSAANVLEIMTRKQDAKGADLGEVASDGMKSCMKEAIADWTFDPAPEVDYTHTYTGRVGEAF